MSTEIEDRQSTIDLIYNYCDDSGQNYYVDAKGLLKYLRRHGITVKRIGDGQKDYCNWDDL